MHGKPERNKERSYVDLTASPYEYSYDNPIMYNDPSGEQPPQKRLQENGVGSWFGQESNLPPAPHTNNPQKPGLKEVAGMVTVTAIYLGSTGKNNKDNFPSKGYLSSENIKTKTDSSKSNLNRYRTDNTGKEGAESAEILNLYVNYRFISNVDEKQSDRFYNYETFVVKELLKGFITGTGSENYNFPTNGLISSTFSDSYIMDTVYKSYLSRNLEMNKSFQISFGPKELANDTKRNNGNIFNITGFVGSATVKVSPETKGYKIQIFNITSLSSGAIVKKRDDISTFPRSYVRDPKKTTPFGNISQTFNLFIPYTSPLLIYNK